MKIFKDLTPEPVWSYFEEICKIPRPSKKEAKIIDYLMGFGKKYHLETERDEAGNVLIRKPAAKGQENLKTIVLQSHLDMVCEKNSDIHHNFSSDPIVPYVDGKWVKARGTTLGADDGIGIATQLSLLESKDIQHGQLECLFTVDEESGMTGAHGIEPGWIKGKILINLDSEDEGELFIGCAGGVDTLATFRYKERKTDRHSTAYRISITGLKGGHSGDEIDKGLGNSVKILNRILWNATEKFRIRLREFDGGNLRNAIPREAFAILTIKEKFAEKFEKFVRDLSAEIKKELSQTESELSISLKEVSLPEFTINPGIQRKLLRSLYACPNGVIAYNREMEGFVETSTNLASVKFIKDNQILVTTSQRSSVESAKKDILDQVTNVFKLAGARVVSTGDYPGWKLNTNSEILRITEESYKRLFKIQPAVRAIHAGLECGLFLEKYPEFDMISFGPTIKGAHSPDERLDIKSTQKFWDLLVDVIRNIPEN